MPGFFGRYQSAIDQAMRSNLRPRQAPLFTTLRYYLGWVDTEGNYDPQPAGKRVRPTLCMLACEAAGGEPTSALPAAVSLEFVHNFSLVHDDIEDNDRTRHHRLTVWAVWGIPIAIDSGNAFLGIANLAVARLRENGIPAAVAVEVGSAIADHYLKMVEGQYLDISYEERLEVSVDEYLAMIRSKTGALIECSVYAGALVGGWNRRDRKLIDALRNVGRSLGYVFQIRDDVLGVWGGQETGKPVGADITRKKKSLPAVHAISTARGAARAKILEIYRKDSIEGEDLARVLQIMDDLRTQAYCNALAAEHWQAAKSVLESSELADGSLTNGTAGDFIELGEFLLARQA
ncbi:MAG: polyprenyl synthetase family protein [SAR202 cluster bacterium]|nr:polyprenyl synthetase family protein [SAR202 cluster bacterium]